MKDGSGRSVDYLRISVTDQCNLRCRYCMPETEISSATGERIVSEKLLFSDELHTSEEQTVIKDLPVSEDQLITKELSTSKEQLDSEELSASKDQLNSEEILRIVVIMADLGIRKVRITGGEPLVRRDTVKLIRDIHTNCKSIEEIAMTTNGILLDDKVEELKAAGLQSVNISLNSTDPQEYRIITGKGEYEKVIASMEKALASGLQVKLNCVGIRQLNRTNICRVADMAEKYPVDVRFIELMPLGCGKLFEGIPAEEILHGLEEIYGTCRESRYRSAGPARYYEFPHFRGKIGFISPMSHNFCQECSRVRLTSDGRLKLCLYYDAGIDLKTLLRTGVSDNEIMEKIKTGILEKPIAHEFCNKTEDSGMKGNVERGNMYQIGG